MTSGVPKKYHGGILGYHSGTDPRLGGLFHGRPLIGHSKLGVVQVCEGGSWIPIGSKGDEGKSQTQTQTQTQPNPTQPNPMSGLPWKNPPSRSL